MKQSYLASGSWVSATCANPRCGAEFQHRRSKTQKYCTKECYNRMVSESAERERVCERPGCGNVMTNFGRQEQRFCSVACRNKHTASSRGVNYPECLTCGVSTGSYNRIYCDEHRPRPGRKAAPRKTAECLGCGEEFSRPAHWQGKMHYCSNKCSHIQQKSVRDRYVAILNDKAVVFHSGWEIRFYAACLRFDIPIRSYDGPDIDTSAGTYRPDFIINDDTVIDVKGWLRPESEAKCREAGVHLVTKEDLVEFERSGVLSVL